MALPKPTLHELMQTVKANIKKYRAEHAGLPSFSPSKMAEPPEIEYVSRAADQEVDAVEICPDHPEYMVIGTYSLVKKDEPCDYDGQTRKGTIQVMTVSPTFKPKYAGMLPPQLDRTAFPCAVLDIHFHPADRSLLGVATSNAQMHFFRFVKHGDVLGRRVITKLLPLGTATVAENDEHGLVPLITQFTWFPETRTHGVSGISDVQDVLFAVVTSFGDAKVIATSLPAIKDLFDDRSSLPPAALQVTAEDLHRHDLEAWTVAVPFDNESSSHYRMVISGGDDSALIASAIELPRSPTETPTLLTSSVLRDRRSHTAGVTSILPLPRIQRSSSEEIIPFLTGSYDDHLRVYEITTGRNSGKFKTEFKLNGGVWRLKLLDQYNTLSQGVEPSSKAKQQGQKLQQRPLHHTLILASLMHAGAAILRLTYDPAADAETGWMLSTIMTFRAGHESMVYCCDARVETQSADDGGIGERAPGPNPPAPEYTIVSTSFYDMKICTWRFVDEFKGRSRV